MNLVAGQRSLGGHRGGQIALIAVNWSPWGGKAYYLYKDLWPRLTHSIKQQVIRQGNNLLFPPFILSIDVFFIFKLKL